MALVAKNNQNRNTIAIVLLVSVVLAAAVYLFRGTLFPPAAPTGGPAVGSTVRDLPVYPDSGLSVLNTNTAQSLTPHGDANLDPCPGRDNPFEPTASTPGCP